jgi:hypothetical protein
MTGETLAEILSGEREPSSRAELHGALDTLLDAADADGGRLQEDAFWAFVASLAVGRGIAEGIRNAAIRHVARGGLPEDDPTKDRSSAERTARIVQWAESTARTVQWALLAAALRRLTASPGEIVPREFQASWFIAVADNIVSGKGVAGYGHNIDLLGLGTQRGSEDQTLRRAARQLLVGAVYFRAEQNGQKVACVLRELLPELPHRTWKDWVREVARTRGIPTKDVGKDVRAAVLEDGPRSPFNLSDERVKELMKDAWSPAG